MREAPSEVVAAWRSAGLYPEATLGSVAMRTVSAQPSARLIIAGVDGETGYELAAIHDVATRLAAAFLRLGLRPGDVVAVQMSNAVETVITHAAVAHAGLVLLPIIHIYSTAELSFVLAQSGAKAIVTPHRSKDVDHAERIRAAAPGGILHVRTGPVDDRLAWRNLAASAAMLEPVPGFADDLTLLVYTSGTTSVPKGVRHSHRSLLAELLSTPQPPGTALSAWPPGHVAGVLGYLRFWVMGWPTILMEAWDAARAAELIERHGVSSTSGTPFHLMTLLDAAEASGRDLSSLTDYLAGATMIPPSLIGRCDGVGLRTYRSYGLSEHPTVSRGSPEDTLTKRVNTDGRLCPGVEVRIVDEQGRDLPLGEEGEILSRGPDRFVGYHDPARDADVLLDGGWFRTGDIGRVDADDYLTITDRKKDIIIRGGENISSREVEDQLLLMPGVGDAAVVGAPDTRLGERVCAFVVAKEDAPVNLALVQAHFAASGLARQKTPEVLVVVPELPRNAAGKVLKPVLRQQLAVREE